MYKQYWTYILSNKNNTALYIGVTDNLERRVREHRSGLIPGFTQKYNCHKLVYYETYSDINQAIEREKQLKKWSRIKKEMLIDGMNKERVDLFGNEISPRASLGRNDREEGRNDREEGRNDTQMVRNERDSFVREVLTGIPAELPEPQPYDGSINHAPKRKDILTREEKVLALKNALRYFEPRHHDVLAKEFAAELEAYGRIYMYRFRPRYEMYARPIDEYPAKSRQAAAIMAMIQNNLDPRVAQHPHELIIYGGNGAIFQNWAQYRLTMQYLATMTDEQTLVMYSGHPLGLFPSHRDAPRVIVTNGMVIPNYSKPDDWERFNALGVSQYGQMTAGSYMYIGPQGIVHGTTITVMNAARKVLKQRFLDSARNDKGGVRNDKGGVRDDKGGAQDDKGGVRNDKGGVRDDKGGARDDKGGARDDKDVISTERSERRDPDDRAGMLFVTAGLGGMSGAQPKAGNIAGVVSVTAEINPLAARKRYEQGWVDELHESLDELIPRIRKAVDERQTVSLAYVGNVVDLWERLADEAMPVDLGSDQTSLHNPWAGGYYPAGYSLEESKRMMAEEPQRFKEAVQASLRRQVAAINRLTARGMYFFDYGNAFLLESSRAGADVLLPDGSFRYPSYVQDIMGPLYFDYGFGPFRWVCMSEDPEDLALTDALAVQVLGEIAATAPEEIAAQMRDNIRWIEEAGRNALVVGSQARILYADCEGRTRIALAFNEAIRDGRLHGPVVLGRDHHDVSGTDSPFRETSNIYDGSRFTADMAVQNVIGDSFRGATWVSIHNGGGVGWGEVINGGFGMVIDGSEDSARHIREMLFWDVNNGIARRSWARNAAARFAIEREMARTPELCVTLPNPADEELIRKYLEA